MLNQSLVIARKETIDGLRDTRIVGRHDDPF